MGSPGLSCPSSVVHKSHAHLRGVVDAALLEGPALRGRRLPRGGFTDDLRMCGKYVHGRVHACARMPSCVCAHERTHDRVC